MKITPYLLHLNGFTPYKGRKECWERLNTSKLSGHDIWMMVEPACAYGDWHVQYVAPGVKCDFYVHTFQDLMAFSEVMARNRHGYTDVDPIEVYVPNIYTEYDWERGEYDQFAWNEREYRYGID